MKAAAAKHEAPAGGRHIEYMPLSALKAAKRNPKKHAENEVRVSIGRFGYVEPMVLDERTGSLVAGHGRKEALAAMHQAGNEPPSGVRVDGKEWMVPVLRGWASRSDMDAEAYLLASNQLTALGGWENGQLAEMLKELGAADALDGVGFDSEALTEILDSVEQAMGGSDPDDIPEPPIETWVKPGDIFELGEHRIICGDSTQDETYQRLMQGERADIIWTDPPWNVDLGGEASTANSRDRANGAKAKHAPIANDNLGSAFPGFCTAFALTMVEHVHAGAPIYLAMSSQEWPVIHAALLSAGFHWSSTIIWAKDSLVLSRKDYQPQYEPIWYGWQKDAARLKELEDRTQSDLWEIPRPKKSDEHPTMKPVELIERALKNSSARSNIVLEPFSGSGSVIVACERLGRRCRAIELEPKYVQVAIERWIKLTGKKARKL